MRCHLLLSLLLLPVLLSGCGSSFFQQWEFQSADVSSAVTDEGELSVLIGIDFLAFDFAGRMEVGLDTEAAEVLLCFVQDPETDPLPICYPIPVSAWESGETIEELPDPIEGSVALERMRRVGMLTEGR